MAAHSPRVFIKIKPEGHNSSHWEPAVIEASAWALESPDTDVQKHDSKIFFKNPQLKKQGKQIEPKNNFLKTENAPKKNSCRVEQSIFKIIFSYFCILNYSFLSILDFYINS